MTVHCTLLVLHSSSCLSIFYLFAFQAVASGLRTLQKVKSICQFLPPEVKFSSAADFRSNCGVGLWMVERSLLYCYTFAAEAESEKLAARKMLKSFDIICGQQQQATVPVLSGS